jgi:threonine aldolase
MKNLYNTVAIFIIFSMITYGSQHTSMKQLPLKSFASDNYAGVHENIMNALIETNKNHSPAYGNDSETEKAINTLKLHFGINSDIYFVFNGTGANVTALATITPSYGSVLCAETSHIYVDECGAPEKFIGCKLVTIPTPHGKLTTESIRTHIHGLGDQHHSQPRIIAITQSTELGTVYTPTETKELSTFAHAHNMLLFMDGARLSNAAASLNCSLADITCDVGVDVLTYGGTKNGMMYGEVVVFFNKELSKNYKYVRKQGMQLSSKMRFIAVQFQALFANDLWKKNAAHANRMAQLLADELKKIPHVKLTHPVEANGVFAIIEKSLVTELQKKYSFYIWNEETYEIRLMTSFDTTQEDITNFITYLTQLVNSKKN